MRYAQQFASELRFARAAALLPQARLGASEFVADFPASISGLSWLLYHAFPEQVAPSPRVGPYRIFKGLAEYYNLSGALGPDEGYVCLYVARAQALCQLRVLSFLAPGISRRNRAMITRVADEGPAACFRNMCRLSKPEVLRPPQSGGLRGFNAVLDTVVGLPAFGAAKNSDGASLRTSACP